MLKRALFGLLIKPAIVVLGFQKTIALKRCAALGTPWWSLWLAAWLPVRLVGEVLFYAAMAVAP